MKVLDLFKDVESRLGDVAPSGGGVGDHVVNMGFVQD